MQVCDLRLKGLKLIRPTVFQDIRGFFLETYREESYTTHGIKSIFVQDNHSLSEKGCVRGMHYQSTPGQGKLIRCALGKIFDVAVDIRPDSPTYGQWESVILDSEKHEQLFIPKGFAHGFCVLSDHAHVMYKVTAAYNPETEKGFRYDDPDVNIKWPVENMIASERDRQTPFFKTLLQFNSVS